MPQKRPLEKRVQVVTGPYRARGNNATKTAIRKYTYESLRVRVGLEGLGNNTAKMIIGNARTGPYRVRWNSATKTTVENARKSRNGSA